MKKDELYEKYAYILHRFQWSKADGEELEKGKSYDKLGANNKNYDLGMSSGSSSEEDSRDYKNKWTPEIVWRKALEPALQLYKWALPPGSVISSFLFFFIYSCAIR